MIQIDTILKHKRASVYNRVENQWSVPSAIEIAERISLYFLAGISELHLGFQFKIHNIVFSPYPGEVGVKCNLVRLLT